MHDFLNNYFLDSFDPLSAKLPMLFNTLTFQDLGIFKHEFMSYFVFLNNEHV